MTIDVCIQEWKDTGDTRYEAYIGFSLVELMINNKSGEPMITSEEVFLDLGLAYDDLNIDWEKY